MPDSTATIAASYTTWWDTIEAPACANLYTGVLKGDITLVLGTLGRGIC
jgi:hypothetical protein